MQARQRRRIALDLSDPSFDFVFEAAEFDGRAPRDALVELILRGAGMEPVDAAVVVARRVAFNVARAEASALLGELGRKLSAYSREQTGAALAEVQMAQNEAEAERRAAHEASVADALARLRAGAR